MPSQDAATEQSPLLQHPQGEHRANKSASLNSDAYTGIKAATNGSPQHNVDGADVERRDDYGSDVDLEAVRIAKSIKYILPVLAVGVQSTNQ